MNVHKPRLTFTWKDINVIFQFCSPKRKTHKIHMNNARVKLSKNMFLGEILKHKQKIWLIWTYDHSKVPNYGLVKINKERTLDMNYHFILQHILSHLQ
jgi:hypothetical protein